MEIFSKDFILGNFRASDYGLLGNCSFSYNGESEDELGIAPTTIEEFIGQNPVPIYLGQKYESKLTPTLTVIKNPCVYNDNMKFSEKELRSILRIITGFKGYQWLKLINEEIDDDLWYRAKVNNISYQRVGGNVVGVIIFMECDSIFAWSRENEVRIQAKSNEPFYVFNNTDDLYNYIFPYVEITSTANGTVSIVNISDNNWTSEIQNIKTNEKITIDSQKEIIKSSIEHKLLLNDFNLHFPRLIEGKNEYISNTDITITFKFRVPRKVGFTE
jgi:hypothetical protein